MSDFTGIEMRWGADWKPSDKRYVAPIVRAALDSASSGLELIQVEPSQPKVATLYQCGRSYNIVGEAISAQSMHLNFSTVAIKRRKLHNDEDAIRTIVDSAAHETLHCLRKEFYDHLQGLLDLIVDEGIAYVGSELIAQKQGVEPAFPIIDLARGFNRSLIPKIEDEIVADADAMETNPQIDLTQKWLNTETGRRSVLPMGVLYGAVCVTDMLDSGSSMEQIIASPTNQIMLRAA